MAALMPETKHRDEARRVAIIFFTLSVTFGVLFALITPPYQAPDESAHFFRSFSLAEGQVFLLKRGTAVGDFLPADLIESRRAFRSLGGNPEAKIERSVLLEQLHHPIDHERRIFIDLGLTAVYSPVTHIPHAAGIAAARLFRVSVLHTLYAARIANVLGCSALIGIAIFLLPFLRWGVALVALLPMAVFLRGSASGDPITTALAFLLFALILNLAFTSGSPSARRIAAVFIVIVLLALTKPIYCSIALLAPVIGRERFASRGRAALFTFVVVTALAAGAALFAAWVASTSPAPAAASVETAPSPIDPGEQLALAVSGPAAVARTLATDLVIHAPRYASHFIGRLGWLDTPLPAALVGLYLLALIFSAVTGGDRQIPLPPRFRLVSLAILLATVLAISLTMYAVWTPVGSPTVEGIQGRYFHPVAPLALLVIANRRIALRGTVTGWFPTLFVFCNGVGLTTTSFVIVARYYG